MPPLYRWLGFLFRWVGAFCIRKADYLVILSDMGVTYPFHSPHFIWPYLPWPSSMIGCIPLGVHYPPASMGIDLIPSALCTRSFQSLQPNHNFPFSHPREALLGRSSGDHLTTFLLWHPPFFTSYEGSLVWCGVGTPVPCMIAAHTQGNTNLWCNEKKSVLVEDSWPSALVHHFVRRDVSCNLMHYLPSLFFPPVLDLPLSPPVICLH